MNEQQTALLHVTPSAHKKTILLKGQTGANNLSKLQDALITLGYEHMNELLKLIK